MARLIACLRVVLALTVIAFASADRAAAAKSKWWELELCKREFGRNAVDVCTAVLADSSLSPEDRSLALAYRGAGRKRAGDAVGALADFEEALKNDPNNEQALRDWGELAEETDPVWAACAKRSAPSENRLAACSQIIDKRDTSPLRRREALKHRSSIYSTAMGRADNDRAVADLNAVLDITPQDAGALIARGRIRKNQGSFEAAIADFTSASQAAPKLDKALVERGEAYEEQGDLDKAKADYEAALKLDNHSSALYKLERFSTATGKSKDSGLYRFNQRVDIGMSPEAATNLASCESGQSPAPDTRIAACNAALAELTEEAAQANFVLFLDRARAFAWRGWASYEKGDYDTALTDLDEAIRTDPNFTFMFVFRGRIHVAKKDYDKAVADLTHAAQNNYQPAFANLAAVYFEQKDYPAAMKQLDEALRRDGSDIEALLIRERVHMALGKPADALRDCQAALAVNPEMKVKHACLAEAKAQPAAAPPVQVPTLSQAQPSVAAVQTSAVPPATSAATPAMAAPSEPPTTAKPSIKNLPKDWITPR